jgi:hypothetical protein
VLDGNEVVFEWGVYENIEGDAMGRFNFLSNKLRITEPPKSGCEPKLIEKLESEKK